MELLKKLTALFAILIIGFVLFIWWRADQGQLPGFISELYNFPYGDKVGHFLLMGGLTFFLCLPFCLREKHRSNRRMFYVMFAVALIITVEEIIQHFFATRTRDLVDLGFSYAGIACFGGLALWICGKQSNA